MDRHNPVEAGNESRASEGGAAAPPTPDAPNRKEHWREPIAALDAASTGGPESGAPSADGG